MSATTGHVKNRPGHLKNVAAHSYSTLRNTDARNSLGQMVDRVRVVYQCVRTAWPSERFKEREGMVESRVLRADQIVLC